MIAAEQKARSTYEYLINQTDDPDLLEPLKFLRAREIVHFQRFGEAKREVSSKYLSGWKPTPVPLLQPKENNKNTRCMKSSRI